MGGGGEAGRSLFSLPVTSIFLTLETAELSTSGW